MRILPGPVDENFIEDFPYTKPAESDARMFIQWKGTDLCIDFYCPCGQPGHFDGYFAHYLQCPACETIYEMGTQVIAKKVDSVPPCYEVLG